MPKQVTETVSDLLSARNLVEDDMTQEADDQPAPEAITVHDTMTPLFESKNDTEHEPSVMCSLYKSLFKFQTVYDTCIHVSKQDDYFNLQT